MPNPSRPRRSRRPPRAQPPGPLYRLTEKGDAWEKIGEAATKRMVARLIPFGADRVILLGGATGMTGNADSLEVIPFGKPEKVTADR